MRNQKLRIMLETALLVAAALLFSLLKLWKMPYGGSVTLEMVPIFVLAFRHGGKVGLVGGALLGFLKLIISPYVIHPVQLLLDYPIPYALLGVAGYGILRKKRWLGVIVGASLRYIAHVCSGVIFFADYAPAGTPALLYSMSYNASYLVAETLLVGVVIYFLGQRREIFEANLH